MLSQSLDVEARRALEAELVEHYHAGLLSRRVTDYSLQQCYDGYDVGILFLFSYPLIIGGFCDMSNPRAVDLATAVLQRSSRPSATASCCDSSTPDGVFRDTPGGHETLR